jgi:hypothetical protein
VEEGEGEAGSSTAEETWRDDGEMIAIEYGVGGSELWGGVSQPPEYRLLLVPVSNTNV